MQFLLRQAQGYSGFRELGTRCKERLFRRDLLFLKRLFAIKVVFGQRKSFLGG